MATEIVKRMPPLRDRVLVERINREEVIRLHRIFGDALRAGAKLGCEEKFFNSFVAGYDLICPEVEQGKKLVLIATQGAHHDSEVVAGFLNGVRTAWVENVIISRVEIKDTASTVGYRFE